jgi:hypothetical protein
MQVSSALRATNRQLRQIDRLLDDVGPERASIVLKGFAGGSQLRDVAPWLTRREASSLILLLSVVAALEPAA